MQYLLEEHEYDHLRNNALAKDALFMLLNILPRIPVNKIDDLLRELRECPVIGRMDEIITKYSQMYIPRAREA